MGRDCQLYRSRIEWKMIKISEYIFKKQTRLLFVMQNDKNKFKIHQKKTSDNHVRKLHTCNRNYQIGNKLTSQQKLRKILVHIVAYINGTRIIPKT